MTDNWISRCWKIFQGWSLPGCGFGEPVGNHLWTRFPERVYLQGQPEKKLFLSKATAGATLHPWISDNHLSSSDKKVCAGIPKIYIRREWGAWVRGKGKERKQVYKDWTCTVGVENRKYFTGNLFIGTNCSGSFERECLKNYYLEILIKRQST